MLVSLYTSQGTAMTSLYISCQLQNSPPRGSALPMTFLLTPRVIRDIYQTKCDRLGSILIQA